VRICKHLRNPFFSSSDFCLSLSFVSFDRHSSEIRNPQSEIRSSSILPSELQQKLLGLLKTGREFKGTEHLATRFCAVAVRVERPRQVVMSVRKVGWRERHECAKFSRSLGRTSLLKINIAS
jgi:hypothetical protein